MTKKTASEKVEEEKIVIDVDEPVSTVEDLPGVGPATAEKLREAGFEELLAIAVMSPVELAEQAELGEAVGLAPTSAWRRVQKLQQQGVIERRVALLDPESLNLGVTALVEVRTGDHSAAWLDRFTSGIAEFPEIVAAWRTSGEVDYMLRVVVPDIAAYDSFYKRLIQRVDLSDVRSIFVMEELKHTTALPLEYVD